MQNVQDLIGKFQEHMEKFTYNAKSIAAHPVQRTTRIAVTNFDDIIFSN